LTFSVNTRKTALYNELTYLVTDNSSEQHVLEPYRERGIIIVHGID